MTTHEVGILAIEVYFPSTFVSQVDLELANGVSAGKYTKGLGQENMAFTGDREDINSISLTVVHSLLEKYKIDTKLIGRVEVGTESLVDKSKSTKTILMSLFAESGNVDIEGATVVNACYGGTAALLNSLLWVDSEAWDGRYALVVAADIAVYADGPARPTGGCGAVAMLIGRNAPLQIDLKTRSSFSNDVWDFFKPKMDSEYPEVNGSLSQTCYLKALETCYQGYLNKRTKTYQKEFQVDDIDHYLFHSPYNKLVQKGFARLYFQDILSQRISLQDPTIQSSLITKWKNNSSYDQSYNDRELEMSLRQLSTAIYNAKVAPHCELSNNIGNTYTAALYMNLANLISNRGESLDGERILLYSYGSGAIATMFEITVAAAASSDASSTNSCFTLAHMQSSLNIAARLSSREKLTPVDLTEALRTREESHGFVPYSPVYHVWTLFPGTYYLSQINSSYERVYLRKGLEESLHRGASLSTKSDATSATGEFDGDASPVFIEDESPTTTTASETSSSNPPLAITDEPNGSLVINTKPVVEQGVLSKATNGLYRNEHGHSSGNLSQKAGGGGFNTQLLSNGHIMQGLRNGPFPVAQHPALSPGLRRSETFVYASGRPAVNVVVTGVAAALPGSVPGVESIQRLIRGENFIETIPDHVQSDMLSKNVVCLVKGKDGTQTKVPVSNIEQNIKLSAPIGMLDLSKYGISESIASTMDRAVQVSVAAGLEALKDAGIVTGLGEDGWVLPVSMQDTTGVVYATSFPALDAAISEVTKYFTSQSVQNQSIDSIIDILRTKIETKVGEKVSEEIETALLSLKTTVESATASSPTEKAVKPYEFDRKFLFRVLVLGNAQLAQIVKARGPNMQTNAACAGSTQAVALAYDMIQLGRAERMIVIAGDNASSDSLMPWLGNGFRALGAATICGDVKLAAIPFDHRRSGMILGAGGIGMILESEDGARRRHIHACQQNPGAVVRNAFKCRLLASLYSNSAYHGAAMDRKHIASEMERFITAVELEHGLSRREIAKYGVYFSHETSTHASASASCAANEIHGLRAVFGEDFKHLLILNTKGFTGHPMGVSFEDVVAAEVLRTGIVPPIANNPTPDPALGEGLKLSPGGAYPCKYALRFAAGFGSQIALALYGTDHPLVAV